jgi:AhpD family alkylhydroperoxidase
MPQPDRLDRSAGRAHTAESFRKEREALNAIVLKYAGTGMKRFFSLDAQAYVDGALPRKTKELLGLVASLALRCDDCTLYHLINCFEAGFTDDEIQEALNVGLVVGGSITIPHIRRCLRAWEEMREAAR